MLINVALLWFKDTSAVQAGLWHRRTKLKGTVASKIKVAFLCSRFPAFSIRKYCEEMKKSFGAFMQRSLGKPRKPDPADEDGSDEELGKETTIHALEVLEHQRFDAKGSSWGKDFLTPTDPKTFFLNGQGFDEFPDPTATIGSHLKNLDPAWKLADPTSIGQPADDGDDNDNEHSAGCDSQGQEEDRGGWAYAQSFLELDMGKYTLQAPPPGNPANLQVRRRRWVRRFAVATTTGSEIGEAGEEEAGDGGRSPQPSSVQMSMSAPAAAAASAAAAHTKELASNLNSAAKNMNKKSVAALSNMKTAMNAKVAAARVKVRQGLHVGRRGSSTGANADAESNADIGDGDLVDGNNGVAKRAGETGKVAPTVAALASEKSNFFHEDDSDTSSIRSPAPTPTTASGRSAGNATSAGAGTDNVSVSLATALDAASSNTHKFGCSRDRPSSSPQQQQRLQQSGNEGGNASSTSKGANPKADGEGEGDDGEEGLDKFAVPDTEESRFEMGFEEDNIRDDMSDCSEFREATSDFGDGFSDFGGGGGGGGGAQQQQGRRRSFFSRAISGATSANRSRAPTGASAQLDASSASESSKNAAQSLAAAAAVDPLWRMTSPALSQLGKQLKGLESEARKAEERALKEWTQHTKPVLEEEVAALEKQCKLMRQSIEDEASRGIEHINRLENKLGQRTDLLDEKKKKLYFPANPALVLGQDGVYVALDDFWLEFASGQFQVDLLPNQLQGGRPNTDPEVKVQLMGTKSSPEKGVNMRFNAEGFKLVGDKGKRVPKIKFDNLKVTIALALSMTISFDMLRQKWVSHSKNFQLKIISFKGPYGLNRSLVSMVVSLISPLLRSLLTDNLPPELGMLLRSLPAPCRLRGEFDVRGTDMGLLSCPLYESNVLEQLCEYTPQQLHMFTYMQRAMERDRSSLLRCVADIIKYRRMYGQNESLWRQILEVWSEVSRLFCEGVIEAKMEAIMESEDPHGSFDAFRHTVQFSTMLRACDDVMKKRFSADLHVQYVEGQVSLNMLLIFIHQIRHRLASAAAATAHGAQAVRLAALISAIETQYEFGLFLLDLVQQNINFANLTVMGGVHAGPEGHVGITVSDLLAQLPLQLSLRLREEKNLGSLPMVPFLISMIPLDTGDMRIEIHHFTHHVRLHERRGGSDGGSGGAAGKSNGPSSAGDRRSLSVEDTITPNSQTAAAAAVTAFGSSGNGSVDGGDDGDAEGYKSAFSRSSAGLYSTSYNRALKAITDRRKERYRMGLVPLSAGDLERDVGAEEEQVMEDLLGPATGAAGNAGGGGSTGAGGNGYPSRAVVNKFNTAAGITHLYSRDYAPLTAQLQASHQHLAVKQEHLQAALRDALGDHPRGDDSDTIVVVVASNPHIGVIADKAMSMAAGEELVTVMVGSKAQEMADAQAKSTKKSIAGTGVDVAAAADGEDGDDDDGDDDDATSVHGPSKGLAQGGALSGQSTHSVGSGSSGTGSVGAGAGAGAAGGAAAAAAAGVPISQTEGFRRRQEARKKAEAAAAAAAGGCPVFVQTAPGIKLLARVAKSDIHVDLPGALRFLLAHFHDIPLLKAYLEIFIGGEFLEEQLAVVKILLELGAKYLLLPGLDLELNINMRIVALNGEIMITLETPEPPEPSSSTSSDQGTGSRAGTGALSAEGQRTASLNAANLAAMQTAAGRPLALTPPPTNAIGLAVPAGTTGSSSGAQTPTKKRSDRDNPAQAPQPQEPQQQQPLTAPHAVSLRVEMSLQELIDDIQDIMNHAKTLTTLSLAEEEQAIVATVAGHGVAAPAGVAAMAAGATGATGATGIIPVATKKS